METVEIPGQCTNQLAQEGSRARMSGKRCQWREWKLEQLFYFFFTLTNQVLTCGLCFLSGLHA